MNKTIQLEFDSIDADMLWNTRMKSFFRDQPERFEIMRDNRSDMGWKAIPAAEDAGRGVFYWFDSYLETKIFEAWLHCDDVHDTVILWDMGMESYCLWLDEDPSKQEGRA